MTEVEIHAENANPLGLSTVHISPQQSSSVFICDNYEGGSLVRLRAENSMLHLSEGRDEAVGSVRGSIRGFSHNSRKRLMRMFAMINLDMIGCTPLLVTLTYPSKYSLDWKKWKKDLDNFSKRFSRKYPDTFAFWRLEFQKRGAPHYHLMVFNVEWIDKNWLSQGWFDVVGSGDGKHLEAGTKVEQVRSQQGVFAYCSKYLGKVQDMPEDADVGRMWGIKNRGRYNQYITKNTWTIPKEVFHRVRRILRHYISSQSRKRARKRAKIRFRENDGIHCFLDSDTINRLIQSQMAS